MACTPKRERLQWKRERIKYAKEYKKKLRYFQVGARVESCGGIGIVLKMEGPYKPYYMMYGNYFPEYDLLIEFEGGNQSWHGLVDCSEIPK